MKIGLPSLLFVVFLILKLTHTISWSWWWVTCPLWIGAALWLLFFLLSILFMGMMANAFMNAMFKHNIKTRNLRK